MGTTILPDEGKTREQLVRELELQRRRVAALEALLVQYSYTDEVRRQCELQYRQIVESVSSIILRMDTAGHVLFLNEFGRKFFGFTEEEIIGRHLVGTIVPATDTAGRDLAAMIRDIGQHPERYENNENENMRRTGERVWVAWSNKAVYNGDGTIRDILCVGNDLTRHRKAEQALEHQRFILSERLKELNCLYGISRIIERQDISFEEKLQEIANLIPSAFEFSEIACARIRLHDKNFSTTPCIPTTWQLQRPVVVQGRQIGSVEVYYREQCPDRDEGPFQKEECALLTAVAESMGRFITRKQTQDALIESEIKYKTLFENLPQKICYKDSNLVYISCNMNYAHDLGLQPEDITGKTDYDLFPQDIADQYRAEDRKVLEQGIRTSVEETLHQDGREVIMHKVKTPVKDAAGNSTGIISIFIDITELRRFQREKARFEATIENNLMEISIKNEISEVLLSPRDLTDILHMILIGATAYQALGFNRAFLLLVDEQEKILEGKVATGALTQDEAYRTWARLAQERHTLTELLASAQGIQLPGDDPINRLVRSMKIPLADEASVFTRAMRERQSFNVINGSSLSPADREWVRRLGTDSFALVPLVCRGRSLGVLLADNFINRKPITDTDVAGLLAFANHASLAIDNSRLYERLEEKVEELSRANTELSQSRDKLIQYERLSIVGEMAAKIAHDIRNPMTAIGGFAKRMLVRERGEELNKNYLQIIVQEIDRLEKILNDILSFTKPSLPRFRQADLNQVIHNAYEVLAPELEKSGITYTEHFSPALPRMQLDTDQIRRLYINLIKNAVEAMPEGGSLTITTALENNMVHVATADTGTGIPEEVMDKIFEPFFTSKATGSGLGLTLATQIVRSHGGTIEVGRKEPSGTIVTMHLPIYGPE